MQISQEEIEYCDKCEKKYGFKIPKRDTCFTCQLEKLNKKTKRRGFKAFCFWFLLTGVPMISVGFICGFKMELIFIAAFMWGQLVNDVWEFLLRKFL